MKNILIDTGPLVALFDRDDKYHLKTIEFISNYGGKLVTTWPVLTETLHILGFNVNTQIDFLQWVSKGGLDVFSITDESLLRIVELSRKYSDIPMDLADATLIVASEQKHIKDIITIDSDFYIYRTIRNEYLKNIFI